jgi:crotonobetainyl-CoA:carnitine CoA-transferase CaiB-like acyl-CoA transferase
MSKLQAATPFSPSAAGVLHQARVVDLTQVIAGPYCAMQLALLGAQVLRVEAPGGDPLRWRGGSEPELAQRGLSTHYQAHAAGRERLALLDWNTPEGQAQLHAELAQADVFVCNLRSHVLARTGLDPHKRCTSSFRGSSSAISPVTRPSQTPALTGPPTTTRCRPPVASCA